MSSVTKILKNDTQNNIFINDLGFLLKASQTYTIEVCDFEAFSHSEDLKPYITNGDIIVNNGAEDLSPTLGLKHIEYFDGYAPPIPLPIEEDDETILSEVKEMNFEGNVEVLDEGNGKATITVPSEGNGYFGAYHLYQNSDEEDSTNSTTYQDKIDYTTPSLVPGKYRFAFCAEGKISNSSKNIKIRLLIDDTQYAYTSGHGTGQDGYEASSGFVYLDFESEDTHSIKLQWCSSHHSKTAYIKNARIEIWRVE